MAGKRLGQAEEVENGQITSWVSTKNCHVHVHALGGCRRTQPEVVGTAVRYNKEKLLAALSCKEEVELSREVSGHNAISSILRILKLLLDE